MFGFAQAAVCLGHRLQMLRWTAESIHQNVLHEFGVPADLFIYSTRPLRAEDLPQLWHWVVDVDVEPDEEAAVVELAAREGRSWPPPLEKMSLRAQAAAEGRVWRLTHAPAGSPGVAYMQRRCLERVAVQEHGPREGKRYTWVISTRPDLLWIGPHASLAFLQPSTCHVPSGEDYGGLNDRHVVCPRPLADVYLGDAWAQLWSAEAILWCWAARRGRLLNWKTEAWVEMNPERWLQARLETAGLHVGRLALPAVVVKQQMARSDAGGLELFGKYTSELKLAETCLQDTSTNRPATNAASTFPECQAVAEKQITVSSVCIRQIFYSINS